MCIDLCRIWCDHYSTNCTLIPKTHFVACFWNRKLRICLIFEFSFHVLTLNKSDNSMILCWFWKKGLLFLNWSFEYERVRAMNLIHVNTNNSVVLGWWCSWRCGRWDSLSNTTPISSPPPQKERHASEKNTTTHTIPPQRGRMFSRAPPLWNLCEWISTPPDKPLGWRGYSLLNLKWISST
jgi:hypothetical protein